MKRSMGIAYCGLACCACGENGSCAGCKWGGCKDKSRCKPYDCCREKGLQGCWECPQFPCEAPILQKTRVQAFCSFVGQWGEEALLDALERGEAKGLQYHYPGQLVGDYDLPQTDREVHALLLQGMKTAGH